MEWHYAKGGQQQGPVSDAELEALVQSGTIDDATLVWRPGLANWQPYGTSRREGTPPPILGLAGVCSVCQRPLPADDLVELLGRRVCAGCKPSVVQGLREGVSVGEESKLWRHGKQLVMARAADLPHRCVKCNAAASLPLLKRSLSWHHPALYLIILVALLIYVIVALIVSKRAKIQVGLCPRHQQWRWMCLWIAWVGVLSGIAGIVYGIAAESWLGGLGALALLTGILVGNFGARVVYPTRIDDRHVWLKGVCQEFLAGLPEWPGK